jgi:hypothetical protein
MPAIEWAHIIGQEGGSTVNGDQTQIVTWQLYAEEVNTSPHAILSDPSIPADGEIFKKYELADPLLSESFTDSYTELEDVDENLRVVDRRLTQDKNHPQVYTLTVTYGGKTDPIFELPRVEHLYEEYQEYTNYDVNGRLVENSALDPITGGMPRDGGMVGIKITRFLAWADWYSTKGEPYLRTLNKLPFTLCRQVDEDDEPIVIAPGRARIKSIIPTEMVRSRGTTPADSSYYWMVTATIMFDDKVFPLQNGKTEPHLHRYVVADRGFNKLVSGKKTPIYLGNGEKPTEEQFLRKGVPLTLPSNDPPDAFQYPYELGRNYTVNDYYSCATATLLSVAAPGVLANDDVYPSTAVVLDVGPTHDASFTLNSDGSFNYTSDSGFVGWDSFTYHTESDGLDDSYTTTVLIRVGPQPVFLAFDRYRYADWTPLAALLEDW